MKDDQPSSVDEGGEDGRRRTRRLRRATGALRGLPFGQPPIRLALHGGDLYAHSLRTSLQSSQEIWPRERRSVPDTVIPPCSGQSSTTMTRLRPLGSIALNRQWREDIHLRYIIIVSVS